ASLVSVSAVWNCSYLARKCRARTRPCGAYPQPRMQLSNADLSAAASAALVARTALPGGHASPGDRLVHDAADGAGAAAALGAATEAAIDLTGRARGSLGRERAAHVVVAQHIAGADDHGSGAFQPVFSSFCNYLAEARPAGKAKTREL